ncbi:MAG TPA: FAD:protein FMN transferase [Solirubrobacteraceae bacterium]|jgi:thiamine biosynthesis lipoprotein|nr:FAD:protein FMN transferase [Solirubrobacteraceae bacterium]
MSGVSTVASETFAALGTSAVVATTHPGRLATAVETVRATIDDIDRACSRFRPDSEISRLNAAAGGPPHAVSRTFIRVTRCALRAAAITDGDVDPTIGSSLRAAGYDRDFAALRSGGPVRFRRAGGWRCVELDALRATIRLPAGVELDYGATAKALAADMAAMEAARATDAGILVSLGGDIATSGPAPAGGWIVRVADDSQGEPTQPGQTVSIADGGLATSSTTARRWVRGEATIHHILDPSTGAPAAEHWRTVSVAAATCVDSNVASTAAIVRGDWAVAWLEELGLPARLVAADGSVTLTGGWPLDVA